MIVQIIINVSLIIYNKVKKAKMIAFLSFESYGLFEIFLWFFFIIISPFDWY